MNWTDVTTAGIISAVTILTSLHQSCSIFSCNPQLAVWPQVCLFYSLQLWLPDTVGQRLESHPHQHLHVGNHRRLGGHWRHRTWTVFLSPVTSIETLIGSEMDLLFTSVWITPERGPKTLWLWSRSVLDDFDLQYCVYSPCFMSLLP